MAKPKYDGALTRHSNFAAAGPNGEPASGLAVQNYIKGIDAGKVGVGYTLPGGVEHLFFADEEDRDAYIADPTKTELIIDRIEFGNLYNIGISMITPAFNPVLMGSTGNTVSFTFQTLNAGGQPVTEDVTVRYVISRGANTQTINETYRFGTTATLNIDNYLLEGTNSINIYVAGKTTGTTASESIEFQVINLQLSDSYDISNIYDTTTVEGKTAGIPYAVSGVGQKVMEWYIDGVRVPYVQNEDEITESSSERTKYLNLEGLAQGLHSLQFRVGLSVSGQTFYSQTLYRDIIVNTGNSAGSAVIPVAVTLPVGTVLSPSDSLSLNATQYEAFNLRIAAWNPDGTYSNNVVISSGADQLASVQCNEGYEYTVPLIFSTSGQKTIVLAIGLATRSIGMTVAATTMDIAEITSDLQLGFAADGRTNTSTNKDSWTNGTYSATFTGFDWTQTSGWVDGKLLIPSGASLAFDCAPLASDPAATGKTFEIEFKSVSVNDDNAVLFDLVDTTNNAGIKLTATEIQVKSRGGVNISRRFKTEEDMRISIVINRRTGVTNKCLVFVYFNGILSVAVPFADTDSFVSSKTLTIGGEYVYSGVLLKQIRIYNAALSADGILNNYILYRDTIPQMTSLYEKNNLYLPGTNTFDLDKIAGYLPVMVITGNIPAIEGTTDKKLQITADVRYTNLQDPSRSFTIKNAIITGQGTSSMTYPKKNLRIYTKKSDQTILYDSAGNEVADRLYSFKTGAQPVACWCLKTDFAESSGTHNTGVARLWNDVIKNAQVNGQYVLRTEAQATAAANNYPYDVRTTVDGFPIVVFYHLTEQDDLIFLGKYNFNNDKSTESVFGFCDIPEFDDTDVQCFEFLDSGNPLALFTTIENFDSQWDKAWESRYPDTKTPNLVPLKTLATWLVSVAGADPEGDASAQAKFAEWQAHKADHFDLNKLASYYVYLMRFGAVDQTVKNSMIMTEDGQHWFFILYDNDTIFGVRNDGLLRYGPDIDRQTADAEIGGYAYAGHGATIWNNFEADPECMALAKQIDDALYSAGLTYENVINMFNNLQAGKWAEKIYNQDAQYKYIGPYVNQQLNYLGSLQGARSDHRKWWVASRFAKYDALYVNSAYQGKAITLLIPGAPEHAYFHLISGKDFYYGFGENNLVMESGIYLEYGYGRNMYLTKNMEIGSPLRIYAPYYIKGLILDNLMEYIGATNFNLSAANDPALGTKMKVLRLGPANTSTDLRRNTALANLSGLSELVELEELNVAGYQALTSLNLSTLVKLKEFYAYASGLTSVTFASGAPLTTIEIPSALQVLTLRDLSSLQTSGISSENDLASVYKIEVRNCPNVSNSPSLIQSWMAHKTTANASCEVYMDNIEWNNMAPADLLAIGQIKVDGGTLNLRGHCHITSSSQEIVNQIVAVFGTNVFNQSSEFYVTAPDAIYIAGPASVLEGENVQYTAAVFSQNLGTVTWDLVGTRTGTSLSASGLLTTTESGAADSSLTIRATHVSSVGSVSTIEYPITVAKRIYPSSATISGSATIKPNIDNSYTYSYDATGVTGVMNAVWSLSGDLTNYASILSQDNNGCVVHMSSAPSGANSTGTLTLTLKKASNNATVLTATKSILYQNMTVVTINEVTNQSSHSDVASVSATVTFSGNSYSVANGSTVEVPTGTSFTVTYPAVTGYATPAPITLTASGSTMSMTGTYNTEVVTVTASTDQQGVTAEGQIITINGNALTVGASGEVSTKVPYGTSYTITANKKTEYNTPASQSFTANQASRSVTVQWTYKGPEGAFILYTDGTTSKYDTLVSGKTPVGVALVTDNVSLVLHPNEGSSKQWSSDTSTAISGVTTTYDRNTAMADYAGASNTAAVVASGLAGSAFTFATTDCVYADGKTGYLPSAGEMEDIRLNATDINTALALIGGTALNFSSKYYWSSTQYSSGNAWRWLCYSSTWYDGTKGLYTDCRSVAAL